MQRNCNKTKRTAKNQEKCCRSAGRSYDFVIELVHIGKSTLAAQIDPCYWLALTPGAK